MKSDYFIEKFKQKFNIVEKGEFKYMTPAKNQNFLYFIHDFESVS